MSRYSVAASNRRLELPRFRRSDRWMTAEGSREYLFAQLLSDAIPAQIHLALAQLLLFHVVRDKLLEWGKNAIEKPQYIYGSTRKIGGDGGTLHNPALTYWLYLSIHRTKNDSVTILCIKITRIKYKLWFQTCNRFVSDGHQDKWISSKVLSSEFDSQYYYEK